MVEKLCRISVQIVFFWLLRSWEKQGTTLAKTGFETQKFASVQPSAAGPAQRRGALRVQRCGARLYGTAGLLPCFGILAHFCDLKSILSRF